MSGSDTAAGFTRVQWDAWVEAQPPDMQEPLTTLLNYAFHYLAGFGAGGVE